MKSFLVGLFVVLTVLFQVSCDTGNNTGNNHGNVNNGTTYSVTIEPLTNGTITASPNYGIEGVEIILTVNPANGYRLKAGSLRYETMYETVFINETDKKFNLPAANVTIMAEFEPVLIVEETFFVTIGQLTNGTITANPTHGIAGTEITLTLNPRTLFRLKEGSLKYGTTTIDEVTKIFIMPAHDVSVTAEFEPVFTGAWNTDDGSTWTFFGNNEFPPNDFLFRRVTGGPIHPIYPNEEVFIQVPSFLGQNLVFHRQVAANSLQTFLSYRFEFNSDYSILLLTERNAGQHDQNFPMTVTLTRIF